MIKSKNNSKTALIIILLFAWIHMFISLDAYALSTETFSDINSSAWYFDAVDYVLSNGILSGTEDNTFSPNTFTTRAMFITALGRYANMSGDFIMEEVTTASDITNFYHDYIVWAYANDIVNGVNSNNFDPTGYITREQAVTMLYRFAIKFNYDSKFSSDKYSALLDSEKVSSYAVEPFQWALSQGIIAASDNMADPTDLVTRAQASQMLFNFSNVQKALFSVQTTIIITAAIIMTAVLSFLLYRKYYSIRLYIKKRRMIRDVVRDFVLPLFK